jgi:transposase, IS30 family
VSIHNRLLEEEERLIPGHWEVDLIKGYGNRSALDTVIVVFMLFGSNKQIKLRKKPVFLTI